MITFTVAIRGLHVALKSAGDTTSSRIKIYESACMHTNKRVTSRQGPCSFICWGKERATLIGIE
jgi:hypothetical protein